MSDTHASRLDKKPFKITRDPVFKVAKQCVTAFAEAEPTYEASVEGDMNRFRIDAPAGSNFASVILMKGALASIDSKADVGYNVTDDENTIDMLLPTKYDEVPSEKLIDRISAMRRALVEGVEENPSGGYVVKRMPGMETLDVHTLLYALKQQAGEHNSFVGVNDETGEHDWKHVPHNERPQYTCYYQVPVGQSDHLKMMTYKELERFNEQAVKSDHKPADPAECFAHATLNDAAMAMLGSAIGIRSARAMIH